MWPQVPVRAKVIMAPYVLLALIGLFAADDAGLIQLPEQPSTHRLRSPRATDKAKAQHPSRAARADIPRAALGHYRHTCRGEVWRTRQGRRYACWAVLAAIGKVESDHGRSRAPGVRSGVNRHGCCAGPMQFNLRDGPPSTWDRWGRGDVYDLTDAARAAARKLRADGAARHLERAVHAYNHDWGYVAQVLALARHYQH